MAVAVKHLWNLSQDELVQERMEAIEKQRRDRVAELVLAEEKGIEKGIEKSREETAIQMIKKSLSIDLIKECTGLADQKIKELKENLKP